MKDFFSHIILGNSIESYAIVSGIILIMFVFKKYLSRYIARILFRFMNKAGSQVRREPFVKLVLGPLQLFLMIAVIMLAIGQLNFPPELNFKVYRINLQGLADSIGAAILIIALIWLLLRVIDFIALVMEEKANLTEDLSDNQLIVFFKDFFKVIVVIIGILLLIRFTFQKQIGPLLTGLSIVGAAVALAARESLENLIASFIIFFDKPFTLGDLVKVQAVTGTVERIGLRSTRIRTDQKTFVTVPNKQMVDSLLDNFSLRTHRRGELRLELNSQTPSDDVKKLIDKIKELLKNGYSIGFINASVYLTDVNRNGIVVLVEYFTEPISMDVFNQVRERFNFDVLKLLEDHEIKLAMPKVEM
ncbi:MAG TPA: mechanosensitive ion channel domain-containing protein [Chitinophagaceae bacterium]|nr:mechanosensitive ion channel domain-containing protein [Chitinophagaceae bacterium]